MAAIILVPNMSPALTGCNACADEWWPVEKEERGRQIEQSFEATPIEDLERQRWAGSLCENHPCGLEVTEDQAKDLLDAFLARRANWWQSFAIWSGLIFAGLSLALSLLAYRQTSKNERDIGRLESRESHLGEKQ